MRARLARPLLASLTLSLAAAPVAATGAAQRDVCTPLQGDSQRWERNADRRASLVEAVESDSGQVEIVYTAAALRQPVAANVDGLDVTRVTRTADGRLLAQATVDGALASACGSRDLALRTDDALGTGWQVVSVLNSGVLLLGGDRLVWLARDGAPEPDFRMVWVSPFELDMNAGQPASPRKSTKKKPRRRRRG
jgi:hypothetical protein